MPDMWKQSKETESFMTKQTQIQTSCVAKLCSKPHTCLMRISPMKLKLYKVTNYLRLIFDY